MLVGDVDIDGGPLTVAGFTVNTDNDGTQDNFAAGATANITGIGALTINANGSYTFVPAPAYNGPVPVATYTVSDGNGGTDTGTLTLTVTPVNDPPVVDVGSGTVYEAALATGTTPNLTTETTKGLVTISDVDNTFTGVVGEVVVKTQGSNGTASVTWNATEGKWEWTYTLTTPEDNDSTGTNIEPGTDAFVITVNDGNGGVVNKTINMSIVDDVPSISYVSPGVIANEASGYLTGQVVLVPGADRPATADLTSNVTGWTPTTSYGATSLTSSSNTVYYSVNPANKGVLYAYTSTTPGAYTGGAEQVLVFTLTVNPTTGQYIIDMNQPLDASLTTFGATFDQNIGGFQEFLSVTDAGTVYKPGETIPSGERVIMTVDSSTGQVNSSTQGLSNASQWLPAGESMTFTFSEPIIDAKFAVDFKSLGAGDSATVSWTAYGDGGSQSGTLTMIDGVITEIPTTLTNLTRVNLTTTSTEFRVSGSQLIDRVEQGDIDTTFKVAIQDSDGDLTAPTTFAVHFEGSDTLTGTGGNDAIGGSNLNEILVGGAGDDILTGGSGSDTFMFSSAATNGKDTITDFTISSTASDGDALDISALLTGAGLASNIDLSVYLRFEADGSNTN